MVVLPEPLSPTIKKVVVFDLDETLIHCKEDFDPHNIDHVIKISFPDGEVVTAGLNVRPFAIETLKAIKDHF